MTGSAMEPISISAYHVFRNSKTIALDQCMDNGQRRPESTEIPANGFPEARAAVIVDLERTDFLHRKYGGLRS
jgi:hypothetical protein